MIERNPENNVESSDKALPHAERVGRMEEILEKAEAMYRDAKNAIGQAYDKLVGSGEEKKQQDILSARLKEIFKKDVRNLPYKPGDGIVGGVARRDPRTDEIPSIVAKGFFDCCALILRTPDAISVTHISPLTLDDLEGKPTHVAADIKTDNRPGFIRSAMAKMRPAEINPESGRPQTYEFVQPGPSLPLEEARSIGSNMKVSIISGNPDLARSMTEDFKQGGSLGLALDIQLIELGTEPKDIVTTSKEIFVIDSKNRIIEIPDPLQETD